MTTCSICLEDSNDETKTVACNHIFHATCIDEWLKSHLTCPVCRMRLQEPSFESLDNFLQTVPGIPAYLTTRVSRLRESVESNEFLSHSLQDVFSNFSSYFEVFRQILEIPNWLELMQQTLAESRIEGVEISSLMDLGQQVLARWRRSNENPSL